MTTTATSHNSLKTMSKTLISKMENKKFIVFNPSHRNKVQDQLYSILTKHIWTEEDVNNQVREQVASHSEAIGEQNLTESAAFQSQKKALKSRIGENELRGFYYKSTVRATVIAVRKFLFDCGQIEDVFESDENIDKLVMDTFQTFDETKIA